MQALIEYFTIYMDDFFIPVLIFFGTVGLGLYAFVFLRIMRTGNAEQQEQLIMRVILFIGLVALVMGILIAARSLHLYLGGTEITGTIISIDRTSVGGQQGRYALVQYETGSGPVGTQVEIKPSTVFRIGESVQVIYLPGAPDRAAIRGEMIFEQVVGYPLLFIMMGGFFTSFVLLGWAQKKRNVAVEQAAGDVLAGSVFLILVLKFLLPLILLYLFVPRMYNNFYAYMGKEETIYAPLTVSGVKVNSPAYASRDDACKPLMILSSLNQAAASTGDRIALHGRWGAFTSDKVPQLRGRNLIRRLKVIDWSPEIITVEIPGWLKDGTYSVGVNCYLDTRTTRPSSFREIQIN